VIAVLFTLMFWQRFSDPLRFPELSSGEAAAFAVANSILFFGSILAHELAHAAVFRLRGIRVRGISLFLFGGATYAETEAKKPGDEFWTSVVGPLTSLALGALFLLGHLAGRSTLPRAIWEGLFGYMAIINFLLGVFNLLPGFPLDGGRVFRSLVWKRTGDLARASAIAARVGQVVASLLIVAGLTESFRTDDVFNGLWLMLIGWILFRAAAAVAQQEERQRVLTSVTAGDVMSSPPPTIPALLPVGVAREHFLEGHDGEAFPVVDDTGVIGFVSLRTVVGAPPERAVEDVMVGTQNVVAVRPDERMDAVAARLGEQHLNTALVVDGPRLLGVIEPEDLARYLTLRSARMARFRRRHPPEHQPRPDQTWPGIPDRPDRTDGSRTTDTGPPGSG
jgi:Zn-dependent protease